MANGKVIVLGANDKGISATKLFLKKDIDVLLYDNHTNVDENAIKSKIYGKAKWSLKVDKIIESDLDGIGLCVITSDFSKKDIVYKNIIDRKIPIISDLEWASLNYDGNVVAITGTNGKTTVAEFAYQIIKKELESKVDLIDDRTKCFCDMMVKSTEAENVVVECSSIELEDILEFHPRVAVILNISPDHIDAHENFTNYINAKIKIAANMDFDDILIINYDDSILREITLTKNLFRSRIIFYSSKNILKDGFFIYNDAIYWSSDDKKLKLVRLDELKVNNWCNYENMMVAIAIAYAMNINLVSIVDMAKEILMLPHRLEFVRKKNGVNYYNDAASTNPSATIAAINSMSGKIILIVGGKDKDIDYGDLIVTIKDKVKYLILVGEIKRKIAYKCMDLGYNNIVYASDISDAIDIANSYSVVGDNILYSPACSVDSEFPNIECRGNTYKEKVMKIK